MYADYRKMIIQNMTKRRTCKWCGKTYHTPRTRKYNATKYCSKKCRKHARQEKVLQNVRTYQKRYGKPLKLGTTNFDRKRKKDFQKEFEEIQKEKKRLKL